MKNSSKKNQKWVATTKLLAFPRKIVEKVILSLLRIKNGEVFYYTDPERLSGEVLYFNDPEILKVRAFIKKMRSEQELLLSGIEAYQIFTTVKRTAKISGDIAEVGVYNGGSARLICEAKGNKALYLFDTFEGLPDLCELDDPKEFHKGQYLGSLESVKVCLSKYSDVHFHKGIFPLTAETIKNKRFSFVNLDADLYKSTLSCLEFFYPRMNIGGVIISHDYISVPGVRKAFDEFFKEKTEPIIELPGNQCLIVKC